MLRKTICILLFSIVVGYMMQVLVYLIPVKWMENQKISTAEMMAGVKAQEIDPVSNRVIDNYADSMTTILMPCLNEEANIGQSIDEAKNYLQSRKLAGKVLIVDNNSTDHSAEIAVSHGAQVISELQRGYGRALRTGLAAAKGDVIIFGDCDSTYDFAELEPLYQPLVENRLDFVTGDRFAGQMEEGTMSRSHRIGVPFLSWCGRIRFGVKIHDWHCGIRGIRRDALQKLTLQTGGMEFATEMIAEAAGNDSGSERSLFR